MLQNYNLVSEDLVYSESTIAENVTRNLILGDETLRDTCRMKYRIFKKNMKFQIIIEIF